MNKHTPQEYLEFLEKTFGAITFYEKENGKFRAFSSGTQHIEKDDFYELLDSIMYFYDKYNGLDSVTHFIRELEKEPPVIYTKLQ